MIEVYQRYKCDGNSKAVILPFLGEFGWMILTHLRFAHWYPATDKIVCCQLGEECLYPSATGFITDWQNPIPDNKRCGVGGWNLPGSYEHVDGLLRPLIAQRHPEHSIIRPDAYDCFWHTSDGIKFKPQAASALPQVDICLGVRKREFVSEGNWPHWESVTHSLQGVGLKVGLIGSQATSFDFPADAKAWEHPDGSTAGTVDLLSHCRLYVGADSGLTHLAALMDVPTVMFRYGHPGSPDLTGVIHRANRSFFHKISDDRWERPDEILGAIVRCLNEIK